MWLGLGGYLIRDSFVDDVVEHVGVLDDKTYVIANIVNIGIINSSDERAVIVYEQTLGSTYQVNW